MAAYRCSAEEIGAALACVPADDREVWVRMAMAVKSELGEDGFAVWDGWSRGSERYRAASARAVWRGIKPGGRVTVASLFHEALQHGFRPAWHGAAMTSAQRAALVAERAAASAEAEALAAAGRDAASAKAAGLWCKAVPVLAGHPYLIAKGFVAPTACVEGARQLRSMLVLPVRVAGRLVNLQFIGEDGTKRFLSGGQVKGGSLLLGSLTDARVVLLCEGWATGLSLRAALGLPVVVAFNAGNLVEVAGRLAQSLPDVPLLVAGDADASGAGAKAAERAAAAHPLGRWVLPVFMTEQVATWQALHGKAPSDFNDLHLLAGVEAVRTVLDAALPCPAGNGENSGSEAPTAPADNALPEPEDFPPDDLPSENAGNALPPGFILSRAGKQPGVYWLDPEGEKPPRWICAPLAVEAKTRDADGGNWGRLLAWQDAEGREHRWAMPVELTCSEGGEVARELMRSGLDVEPARRTRELLSAYLVKCKPARLVRSTTKTGWHGNAFVLHDEVIGPGQGDGVFLQSERDESLGMKQAGTLEGWREGVGQMASGNSRLLFALSLAFAAPLAELANESGGFHILGASSAGKSTALEAAASVWGCPAEYGFKWRATSNGMEGICASRNDLLVILDELAQVDPKEAGEAAYLIANGQGKARASRSGAIRTPSRWRVLLLSAGEISLGQHMQEAGKQARAGQEIRLVDIVADAGAGFGLFDTLHDAGGGAALSQRIKAACMAHHGKVGRTFIAKLVESGEAIKDVLRQGRESFVAEDVPADASGQVLRVAGRFALVATAGELATAWGLTGWREGEAMGAAVRLFHEWLAQRGGAGDSETRAGLEAVRAFLETHGESRFTPWEADPATSARTVNRAGFRRQEENGLWFYVLPAAFKRELCKGFQPGHVAKAMVDRGWLKKQAADRNTYKAKLPGMGASNVFLVTPRIWEDEV